MSEQVPDAYASELASIVVDVAFTDPIRRYSADDGTAMVSCVHCGDGAYPGVSLAGFTHSPSCVWARAAMLTRPETAL